MYTKPAFFLLLLLFYTTASAQQVLVRGTVSDSTGQGVGEASVLIQGTSRGVVTSPTGTFSLTANARAVLVISHLLYQTQELQLGSDSIQEVSLVLLEKTTRLQDIEVSEEALFDPAVTPVQQVDARSARSLPSTFGDFNKILLTLPGVSGNNELSSAYSVRGGNFDENLVYVNDIPVYRPFLANAGRQEGLSFVNPDMVSDIEFYAGGWEAKYGDKLSSSLNIEYKEPNLPEGSITVGLLGGTAHWGGKKGRLSYLMGMRHRDSRYLLNTLETEGQYFPTYTDFQSLLTFDLSRKDSPYVNRTKLNWLLSYGRNRYLTEPISQETEFGSVQQNFRLQTAFMGREILRYDTYQSGFRLTHNFSDRLRTHWIGSGLVTWEKEQFDVEGFYRLCDVNNDPNSSSFNDCIIVRGIGSNYSYGRNSLRAQLYSMENRYEFLLNVNHVVEAGLGINYQSIADQINEYTFLDSADYVQLTRSVFNEASLNAIQYYGYLQQTYLWGDSVHALSTGLRFTYWDYNDQLLVSPRLAYRWAPRWSESTTFKLSAGYYQQPPFYRELRGFDGQLRDQVLAQRSIHFIGGMTRLFRMWGRPFLFTTDVYHKQFYDLIPYDIDNVRLRYYANNDARGFAQGVDFRIHGEFVKGTQSWFSLGLLRTQEDLANDTYTAYYTAEGEEVFPNTPQFSEAVRAEEETIGYVRRPMDQRINMAAYFEDHMPGDPSLRVYLNLVFGSGYPFGPPGRARYRNAFSGDEYYRADVGLSKSFELAADRSVQKLWIRLEVLNALGADNTLSYTWIEDVNGNQFAIPNSLSARFLNLKFSAEL